MSYWVQKGLKPSESTANINRASTPVSIHVGLSKVNCVAAATSMETASAIKSIYSVHVCAGITVCYITVWLARWTRFNCWPWPVVFFFSDCSEELSCKSNIYLAPHPLGISAILLSLHDVETGLHVISYYVVIWVDLSMFQYLFDLPVNLRSGWRV